MRVKIPIGLQRALKGLEMAFLTILLSTPCFATLASWFHPHEGDKAMVAASRDYPKGTVLIVKSGDKAVIATVTDWGPSPRFLPDRKLDLSPAAFSQLASTDLGVIPVEVLVLSRPKGIASKANTP
jgi:hypothetical protein